MNIAICDSDRIICNDIARLILLQKPTAHVFIFTSREELLNASEDFSIYFLDIRGIAGLDVAKILRQRKNSSRSILIFVTGYREYMAEAFDVHAFHYILKPIDTKKFSQILDRACAEVEMTESLQEKYLLVKVGSEMKKFFLRDISFIESANKKVVIHSSGGIFETYGKMDALEIALGENFYRCHRCYLVNFEKISAYTPDTIELTNGEKILIAGKKYSDFVKKYLRYAQGGGLVSIDNI